MAFISMATTSHHVIQYAVTIAVAVTFNCLNVANCSPCEALTHYKIKLQDGTTDCVPCTGCPSGQCIANHCYGFRNNVCRTPGLDEYIRGHDCVVCSDCGEKRIILRNCSQHSDTQCGGCIPGFEWDASVFDCVEAPSNLAKQPDVKLETTDIVATAQSLRKTTNKFFTLKETKYVKDDHLYLNESPTDSAFGLQSYIVLATTLLPGFSIALIGALCAVLYSKRKKHNESTRKKQSVKLLSNEETIDSNESSCV